jgi:hypothetical protein
MAFGNATFSDAGAGVSDLFAGLGDQAKGAGDFAEAGNYNLAAEYASQEAAFAKQSNVIQQFQQSRQITKSLGETVADTAGAGFATSGSSMDILRDSASQGALSKAVLGEQGLIQVAGYREQEQSFENMADAAVAAGNAEGRAATGSFIAAGLQAGASIATLA